MFEQKNFANKYLLGWLPVSLSLSFLLLSMSGGAINLSAIVSWTFGIGCISLMAFRLNYLQNKNLVKPEIIWWLYPMCAVFFLLQKATLLLFKMIWILRPFPEDPYND
jgi:hypothetical protein